MPLIKMDDPNDNSKFLCEGKLCKSKLRSVVHNVKFHVYSTQDHE